MTHIKYITIIIFITLLLTFKGVFVDIISNINLLTHKISNNDNTEMLILKNKIKKLEKDLLDISKLKTENHKYQITKFSYYDNYKKESFYITNVENIKVNDLLINEYGLVGIVSKVTNEYSKVDTIKKLKNVSININDEFGTITEYKDNLFIIKDISNISNISLNDSVYTIPTEQLKTPVLIGYVKRIDKKDINKIIYVESNVDFDNINYLYVVGE